MGKYAIRVENLGKQYTIGAYQGRYKSLRDSLTNAVKAPFRRFGRQSEAEKEARTIWALKDVSFEIEHGEVVGIIGRNGAGKSTLLKILARITEPTTGEMRMRGRVGSLLEVGTGFHPELTGRENIFLNGAILGMSRKEIQRKFDEIVDFAEIEKFIDTPAKHYSSGMYMRLAFAVAAHLEPEILLVDEVLAVGDAQFQKKCLGKMGEVAKEGRTVLFVSHQMDAVTRLCKSALLLEKGKVEQSGQVEKVIKKYLITEYGTTSKRKWNNLSEAPGNEVVKLIEVKVIDKTGKEVQEVEITETVGIFIEYQIQQPGLILKAGFNFWNDTGINIFDSHDVSSNSDIVPKQTGRYRSIAWIPGDLLAEGQIIVGAAVFSPDPLRIYIHEKDAVAFTVVDHLTNSSVRGSYVGYFPGIVRPLLNWQTEYFQSENDNIR